MAEKNKQTLTPKQKAAKKRTRIILLIIEVVILVVLLAVLYKVITTLESSNAGEGGRTVIDEVDINEDVEEQIEEQEDEHPSAQYRTIALFGLDSTNGSLGKGNRSDTIIIASVNLDTKDVKLVSVFRDTYLNVGDDIYNKANNAYFRGGPEQAISMLNINWDLAITDYVTVGYEALINTVDALGGIDIEIDSAEIKHINNYQETIKEDYDLDGYTEVTETGMQTVNGLQAAAYCRIRYTAGDDFKRTERQREVIEAIVEKAKQAKVSTLTSIATDVFGLTSTSLELSEILDILTDISEYNIVETEGFPVADERTTGEIGSVGSSVIPTTLAENVVLLHEFLFGEEDYEVSKEVQSYSDTIYEKTEPYLNGSSSSTTSTDTTDTTTEDTTAEDTTTDTGN